MSPPVRLSLFRSSSAKVLAPKTARELERWREHGIIDFSLATDLDVVVASVLRAVREHINERG